ncbi:hypothetical protein P154DRAFT_497515 [Amniculicola lignicola CBS 123094]|uniref:RING-type domain-containing protein n=1 Tax=Amniculicola lignicola CBS 123094 TaxID=1392246 RepID=A0A6A5WAG1_9PLEO|nr:hypothetical protein P154DRAFT_497515 [Amniculicola lignicola CBS 123094]
MAEGERVTMVDLEKELTCSICTDLLYQPLTLLDCLHTFCGACLKEWFAFQASTATSIHPYTCPSCRASVRTTQPNATVTTLLEMFSKAHPEKGKSEQEKKNDKEKYKPGDVVLPKLRKRDESAAAQREEEEERRVLEQVQQISFRRRRSRSRDESRESRNSERREGRSRSRNPPGPVAPPNSREVVPPRAVEHQSSLRSLLSASEIDSQEIEEEIMRQIMEEGLLDGIDLNNIDAHQEDEISERIAQAYRRRQAERQRERRERRDRLVREGLSISSIPVPQGARTPTSRDDEQPRRRGHGRSESGTSAPLNASNSRLPPPISRPGLIDSANQRPRGPHARSSSQGSSRSSRRAERPSALNVSAARSGPPEGGDRPQISDDGNATRRRMSDNQQRSTTEERRIFRESLQPHSSSNPNSPRRAAFNISSNVSPSSSTTLVSSPVSSPPNPTPPASVPPSSSRRTTDPTSVRLPRPANNESQTSSSLLPRSTTDPSAADAHSRPSAIVAPTTYKEPNISCKPCGKQHIEYELHYNCSLCDSGDHNLCLSCYRTAKGCKHWFGFGWAAMRKWERQKPPEGYHPSYERPHVLVGHRYRKPYTPLTESTSPPHHLMSEDDPAFRLESGVFCDMCKSFANGCYWKCDTCNEGAWGFCNDCVNQSRHCTHPLLPIAHKTKEKLIKPASDPPETNARAGPLSPGLAPPEQELISTTPPLTPKSASMIRGPGLITMANRIFRPLTFTTVCNVCTYPIPPSHTRYHCPTCNKGDYDICMGCYHKLIISNRISKEDGMNGWRRCLRGHRMIVVGFEDRDGGQRRIVVRDLVGGHALKEDEPTEPRMQKFPPDGGVGLRVQANWSYYPGEGVVDELMFPKMAEVREVEDINGDWFWGVYAGAKGLFPGNYGRVVG